MMKIKHRLFFFSLFLVFASCFAEAQIVQKFDFGGGPAAKGFTQIQESDFYDKEKGYGFEPDAPVNCPDRKTKNSLLSDFCTSDKPFYFSVRAAEGNYKVTISFGDRQEATATTIKAELRRLMIK